MEPFQLNSIVLHEKKTKWQFPVQMSGVLICRKAKIGTFAFVQRLLGKMNMTQNEKGQSDDSERQELLSTNEARQGVTGHNVRYVLLWSMLAVVLAFGVVVLMIGSR
jgi:heme/copper-type cytochrome/quinol oxidase subunit 1